MAAIADARPPLLPRGGADSAVVGRRGHARRRLCCWAGGDDSGGAPLASRRELSRDSSGGSSDVAPPYSPANEIHFFFGKGIPLGVSSMMNWGLPNLVSMVIAGQTENSAHLQAAVGYGRVWYNCTAMVPIMSMITYMNTMLPGCIGAKRHDRIAPYMQRSLQFTLLIMVPFYALQFVSGGILHRLGVPADIAGEVQTYNCIMVITNLLNIADMHLECVVVNLGYAKSTTVVSTVSGLIQVASSYVFIYRWGWGMVGAALAQITVRASRIACLSALACKFRIWRKLAAGGSGDGASPARGGGDAGVGGPAGQDATQRRLCPLQEWKEFLSMVRPSFLSNLAGWVVFELQMLALTNIRDISKDALAAGAVWVQIEGALASAQAGWLRCCSMRTLMLLGKRDPGAGKAYLIFSVLAEAVVGVSNIFLFLMRSAICRLISNDGHVQRWLTRIIWVLVIHTQTRIGCLNSAAMLIPLEKGRLRAVWTFASFYLIASPISLFVALTDRVTTSVAHKMVACVGLTSIAQVLMAVCFYGLLCRLDWREAGEIINRRANSDRRGMAAAPEGEAEAEDRGEASEAGARTPAPEGEAEERGKASAA